MTPQRNFSKEQERLIAGLPKEGPPPTLLLHACCAPCSSAVLERLAPYFAITLLYYNPNIAPFAEYQKREAELRRLVAEMDLPNPVSFLPCDYDGEAFPGYSIVRSADTLLEVMAGGVTKAWGVRQACAHYGIPLEEAAAFGDNYNDMEMLQAVGQGFLMGNAPKELLERFPHHTADNAHDGVGQALRQLGLA